MQQMYRDIVRNLSANILRPAADGKLAHFQDVVVQDGSSFAVHDALAQTFGGRFTTIRPAAVELHTFLSVFHDQVIDVTVAPDKEAERQFLPPAHTLTGTLLLADRGYQSLDYLLGGGAGGRRPLPDAGDDRPQSSGFGPCAGLGAPCHGLRTGACRT